MSDEVDSHNWRRWAVQSVIGGLVGAVPVVGTLAFYNRSQRLSADTFADSLRTVSIEEIRGLEADPALTVFERETLLTLVK